MYIKCNFYEKFVQFKQVQWVKKEFLVEFQSLKSEINDDLLSGEEKKVGKMMDSASVSEFGCEFRHLASLQIPSKTAVLTL